MRLQEVINNKSRLHRCILDQPMMANSEISYDAYTFTCSLTRNLLGNLTFFGFKANLAPTSTTPSYPHIFKPPLPTLQGNVPSTITFHNVHFIY